MLIPISEIIDSETRSVILRTADEGEEPDFVQEHDKLCTGMIIRRTRLNDGRTFSCEFNPPVQLLAGVGYILVLQEVNSAARAGW